ncbi:MAG: (2Fe-2S)-binding protein [Phycisphaerales bacterium]|nr:(2Fe-2S)-binding protein [Phycisphaerales bacterium]
MPVSRCVCHRLPFEDLKARAAARSLSFEQLKQETRCASGCGMCEPYVRLMLVTGETSFRVLTSAAIRKHLRDRGMNEDALDPKPAAAMPSRATG